MLVARKFKVSRVLWACYAPPHARWHVNCSSPISEVSRNRWNSHRPRFASSAAALDQTTNSIIPADFNAAKAVSLEPVKGSELEVDKAALPCLARHAVEERMVLAYASLQGRDVNAAERILKGLLHTNPDDVRDILCPAVLNAFVEACLQKRKAWATSKAMEWFHFFEAVDVARTPDTYAILLSFFMHARKKDMIPLLLAQMHFDNISATSVLRNRRFQEPSNRDVLLSVFRDVGEVFDETVSEAITDKRSHPLGRDRGPVEGFELNNRSPPEVDEPLDATAWQKWLETGGASVGSSQSAPTPANLPNGILGLLARSTASVPVWVNSLVHVLRRDVDTMKSKPNDQDQGLWRILELVNNQRLAEITIAEFLRIPTRREVKAGRVAGQHNFTRLAMTIGQRVESEHLAQRRQRESSRTAESLREFAYLQHQQGKLFSKEARTVLEKKLTEVESPWIQPFGEGIRARVGSYLAERLIAVAKIRVPHSESGDGTTEFEPAFFHDVNHWGTGTISFNSALYKLLLKSGASLESRVLPMLTIPRPWMSWKDGGYLCHSFDMVRIGDAEGAQRLGEADAAGTITSVQIALDVLGKVPWQINDRVLEVARTMWDREQQAPGLPLPPATSERDEQHFDPSLAVQYASAQERQQQTQHLKIHTDRAEVFHKLETATALEGQSIYFPHSLDFRGRAYPIPSYLNHLGNDLSRGLLLLAQGKPLGQIGLSWLKIQVAALAGYDKASYADRISFAEQHLQDVYESADNPLGGAQWWLQAPNPWQLLAACFELAAALRSSNVAQYESRLPIHQDGTCNGLQHYAALSGDVLGAQQVNLVPGSKPADVYSEVASKVQLLIDTDVTRGVHTASLMKNRVNRKLVKQPVMTNPYGVTEFGARAQVQSRLREARAADQLKRGQRICPETPMAETDLTDQEVETCAAYAAHKIAESIEKLFAGAQGIQEWLTSSAKLITRSTHAAQIPFEQLRKAGKLQEMGILPGLLTALDEGPLCPPWHASASPERGGISSASTDSFIPSMTSVRWTSPLGLPIVQPYRNYRQRVIQTFLQDILIEDRSADALVDAEKQSRAFAPNYIHSLDAAHMMLTATACQEAGIEFAAVHDSFWTHAADVGTMNTALRDAFVRLHSRDLMRELRQEFIKSYAEYKVRVRVHLRSQKDADEWHSWCIGNSFDSGLLAENRVRPGSISSWVDVSFPPLPIRGNFNIEQVRDSKYFFN
ncbi:DNA-directed RNA polymerase [Thoreauomyces humboldtii]|nr:DNA-directed RNA polymerase [Thoreauomyces humboldtii]